MKQKSSLKDLLDREVEKPILEELYIQHGVTVDQLRTRDPQTLHEIVAAFDRMTSRDFSTNLLLRYMMNRRKQADWPTLGKKAKKFESVINILSSSQLAALKQIYFDLDTPSDELLFRTDIRKKISDRFEGLTGAKYSSSTLVAVIMAKRKRGLWIRIREAFGDIAQISRQSRA
jgi:hypothetical protein